MASLSRHIHLKSDFRWTPLAETAPELTFQATGLDGEVPMALTFIDDDGETHVFAFSEDGRKKLLDALTGGLVVASSLDVVRNGH